MSQSRVQSFLEALSNVGTGVLMGFAAQLAVFPLLGIQASMAQSARLPETTAPADAVDKIVRIVIAPGGQQDYARDRDLADDTARNTRLISVQDSFDD